MRRKEPKVRPHKTGRWTLCVGKKVHKDGQRLVPKNFYFVGTPEAAEKEAKRTVEKWAFMVKHWETTYQTMLKLTDHLFAEEPHWVGPLGQASTDAEVNALQATLPTDEEVAEAHADIALQGVVTFYKVHLDSLVSLQKIGNVSRFTMVKNLKGVMAFFDPKQRLDTLTASVVEQATINMHAKLSRRTVHNYLACMKAMLEWWYDSEYGAGWSRLQRFNDAFKVEKRTNLRVKVPTLDEIKDILAEATGRQRLAVLLALNCGMYAVDIGRLERSEINLEKGYIFWDREKQPENPFRVRHDLWPETLEEVKKHLQPQGRRRTYVDDYRGAKPTKVDTSELAFLRDDGAPLYLINAGGKRNDRLQQGWATLNAHLKARGKRQQKFRELRKGANQLLKDVINEMIEKDADSPVLAIQEISDVFLGHATKQIVLVYETRGVEGFAQMNRYLKLVGEKLRKNGVFDASSPNAAKR